MKSFIAVCERWIVAIWRVVPAGLFALASVGAVAQFALKHAPGFGAVAWASWVLTLVACVLLLVWSRKHGREKSTTLLAILGIAVAIRLILFFSLSDFPQVADRLFFLHFVTKWAEGGDHALRVLSHEDFDFPLWVGRAWPFAYPAARIFGADVAVRAVQIIQIILAVALVAGSWSLARRSGLAAAPAAMLAAIAPPLTWQTLEFAYQFQGTALILAAFLLLSRIAGALGAGRRPWIFSAVLGAAIFVMHLQSGLDLLVMAVLIAVTFVMGWRVTAWSQRMRTAVFLVLVPLVVSMPLGRAFDAWLHARDEGRLSSNFIGHMAMGWNTVTWGEYYGEVVAVDRRTPPERKTQVMLDFIKREMRDKPVDVFVKLPVIKLIKLYQVGAASGIEEALHNAGRPVWSEIFRGSRVAFALFLLPLAVLGARRFFSGPFDPLRVALGLFLLGTTTAYTFFSETSPRYSFYLLPVLTLCAAAAFAPRRGEDARLDSPETGCDAENH